MNHANQTVTVQLHRQYRIMEHDRLGWVAEKTTITVENKKKIVGTPKI